MDRARNPDQGCESVAGILAGSSKTKQKKNIFPNQRKAKLRKIHGPLLYYYYYYFLPKVYIHILVYLSIPEKKRMGNKRPRQRCETNTTKPPSLPLPRGGSAPGAPPPLPLANVNFVSPLDNQKSLIIYICVCVFLGEPVVHSNHSTPSGGFFLARGRGGGGTAIAIAIAIAY